MFSKSTGFFFHYQQALTSNVKELALIVKIGMIGAVRIRTKLLED